MDSDEFKNDGEVFHALGASGRDDGDAINAILAGAREWFLDLEPDEQGRRGS